MAKKATAAKGGRHLSCVKDNQPLLHRAAQAVAALIDWGQARLLPAL